MYAVNMIFQLLSCLKGFSTLNTNMFHFIFMHFIQITCIFVYKGGLQYLWKYDHNCCRHSIVKKQVLLISSFLNTNLWCDSVVYGVVQFNIISSQRGCIASLRDGNQAGSTQKVSLFPGVNYCLVMVYSGSSVCCSSLL
jgi:hypothetical protein